MKICSVDLEMCGLDEETCDILEFGAVLDDLRDPAPIECLPTFQCYFVLPHYRGTPYALSMHSEAFKRIESREAGYNYVTPSHFGILFKRFLLEYGYETKRDKITINVAGKNFAMADYPFLKNQTDFCKHIKVRNRVIDPAHYYLSKIDETLPNMEECKGRAGLGSHVAHNAVDDALDVVKLLRFKLKGKFS